MSEISNGFGIVSTAAFFPYISDNLCAAIDKFREQMDMYSGVIPYHLDKYRAVYYIVHIEYFPAITITIS